MDSFPLTCGRAQVAGRVRAAGQRLTTHGTRLSDEWWENVSQSLRTTIRWSKSPLLRPGLGVAPLDPRAGSEVLWPPSTRSALADAPRPAAAGVTVFLVPGFNKKDGAQFICRAFVDGVVGTCSATG